MNADQSINAIEPVGFATTEMPYMYVV